MNNKELEKILERHRHWLKRDSDDWQNLCAILIDADLRGANLSGTNLRGAILIDADLNGANLRGAILIDADLNGANLSGANLNGAILIGTNLRGTNLNGANLNGANLSGANLNGAILIDADLRGANLIGANLNGANLSGTDLRGASLNGTILNGANLSGTNLRGATFRCANLIGAKNAPFMPMACPDEGAFIGWKKALVVDGEACIIRLYIPAEAKRSSAMGRKCRCNKAKVLSIEVLETGEKISTAFSSYDKRFIYKVGEYVEVDNFDEDRFNECAPGIHFFINKQEAINY